MKERFWYGARMILVAAATYAMLIGCGDDDRGDQNTQESGFLKALSGKWTVERVTLDAIDVTFLFEEMTLSINSNKSYNAFKGLTPYWPEEGTFELAADPNSDNYKMIRDDGVELFVTALSDAELQVKMFYSPKTSGRVSSVAGEYQFNFKRQ